MALTNQFTAGANLTAARLNESSIPVVSSTADITTPFTGQIIFNTTNNQLYRYTGSSWVKLTTSNIDFLGAWTAATVATQENTTSTSYVALTTAGPAVTLTSVGTQALVTIRCTAFCNVSPPSLGGVATGFTVSGATTRAASDADGAVATNNNAGYGNTLFAQQLITITPGTNTYTMVYKVSTGTGIFSSRRMWVSAP